MMGPVFRILLAETTTSRQAWRHRYQNVPKPWVTTLGRRGCRGAAGLFAPGRTNREAIVREADEPNAASTSLIPSLWPASTVEMLIFLRCRHRRPRAVTTTSRSCKG